MRFPAKITSSCIWVAIPVDRAILHWFACGANGRRADGRAYGHVITKFSRMGRLLHFLTHGASLRALREREAPLLNYCFFVVTNIISNFFKIFPFLPDDSFTLGK